MLIMLAAFALTAIALGVIGIWGVEPIDALTIIAVPAALLVVALLAAWPPARRAARLDPAAVLRE